MTKKKLPIFSRTLCMLMERAGLTAKSLSELTAKRGVRVAASTIGAWKSGSLGTDYEKLKMVASCLGVSLEYLLTGSDEPMSDKVVSPIEQIYFDATANVKIIITKIIPTKGQKD